MDDLENLGILCSNGQTVFSLSAAHSQINQESQSVSWRRRKKTGVHARLIKQSHRRKRRDLKRDVQLTEG